jgi:hypothetical protein
VRFIENENGELINLDHVEKFVPLDEGRLEAFSSRGLSLGTFGTEIRKAVAKSPARPARREKRMTLEELWKANPGLREGRPSGTLRGEKERGDLCGLYDLGDPGGPGDPSPPSNPDHSDHSDHSGNPGG